MKKTLMMIAAAGLLTTTAASAKPAPSEKHAKTAVEFRQALLQLVRSNVGALGAMAKGNIPFDAERMAKNGQRLEQLSLMMSDYFVMDTTGFKVETAALDKLWQNQDDFNGKIEDMTKAAQALQVAATSGDEGQYKAAIGGIFKTCKGCHDDYKAD